MKGRERKGEEGDSDRLTGGVAMYTYVNTYALNVLYARVHVYVCAHMRERKSQRVSGRVFLSMCKFTFSVSHSHVYCIYIVIHLALSPITHFETNINKYIKNLRELTKSQFLWEQFRGSKRLV